MGLSLKVMPDLQTVTGGSYLSPNASYVFNVNMFPVDVKEGYATFCC